MNHYKNYELTDADYRPSPFWSWNSDLEPEELRAQIRAMHSAGIGGFFMHARGGLKTEYLSARWLECVEACLDEAGKLGMKGWLYDENGWPSGFGGGIVNGMGVDYQQKYLVYEKLSAADAAAKADQPDTVAFYDAATLELLEKLPESGDVIRFFYEVNLYYVDNLDGKVVAEFINNVHKFYYENLPPHLLKHLRGIFTDEPQLSRRGILWSFILPGEYKAAYGRDLLPELPCLYFNTACAPAVRTRFWQLVAKLFSVNFIKQIGDWCEAKGWQLTGHHVLEEDYAWQLTSNGTVMSQYEYYHVPGVDHLTRLEPDVLALEQVASVAAQAGQKQILTESFALTGWNFNFRGMKWLYQIQMAHGVNFLCQHLESYSLKGTRKRDYPGSWFTHQPWWEDYKYINDRFTRTGRYLADGSVHSDILVLHGESSAWTLYDGAGESSYRNLTEYTKSLKDICYELAARHARMHLGDEIIMQRDAKICGGKIIIGECSYRSVILPQINNMLRSTYELFKAFAEAGGRIIGVLNRLDPSRMMIDGELISPEEKKFFADNVIWFGDERSAAEYASGLFPVLKTVDENGMICRQLISAQRGFADFEGLGKGTWYYVINRCASYGCQVNITFPGAEMVCEIDSDTGKVSGVGAGTVPASFAPAGSRMYFVPEGTQADGAPILREKDLVPVVSLDTQWRISAPVENIITLDNARWQIEGGEWVSDHISGLQTELLGKGRPCDVIIEYDFLVAEGFAGALDLVVEDPSTFAMELNGVPFAAEAKGYLFDKAFCRVSLPVSAIRPGVNTVRMATRFYQKPEVYECLEKAKKFETEYNKLSFDSELEAVYIAGVFNVDHNGAVEETFPRDPASGSEFDVGWGYEMDALRMLGSFRISAQKEDINVGCINKDGYPFFAGKIAAVRDFELTAGECEKITGFSFRNRAFNSVEVCINGVSCGKVFWEPWRIDIPAGVLKPGRNTIELKMVQSLRNMLGPHHLQVGECGRVATLAWNKGCNAIGWPNEPFNPGYCFTVCGIDEMCFEG